MKLKIIFGLIMAFTFCKSLISQTFAQTHSGNLSIVSSNGNYVVRFTPQTSGNFDLAVSSLVALRVTSNTTTMPSVVTSYNGTNWALTSPASTSSGFTYYAFTNNQDIGLTFVNGTAIDLFSFPIPQCTGGVITIVDPNNLPGGGTGIINNYDYGTYISNPLGGNIAGVTGSGVSCGLILQIPPVKNVLVNTTHSANAGQELAPSGGSGIYTYTNYPSCTPPPNRVLISNPDPIIGNSGTSYSFTAPGTVGNYYFCVRVCDTTPSPNTLCETATYLVNVTDNTPACNPNAGTIN